MQDRVRREPRLGCQYNAHRSIDDGWPVDRVHHSNVSPTEGVVRRTAAHALVRQTDAQVAHVLQPVICRESRIFHHLAYVGSAVLCLFTRRQEQRCGRASDPVERAGVLGAHRSALTMAGGVGRRHHAVVREKMVLELAWKK